jgi:hypothetical protein
VRIEPIIETPYLMTGVWRRFVVHLFEGKVTLSDMDLLEAKGAEWEAKLPGKLVELVVIFPSKARMTQEERVRMAGIIKRSEGRRLASATVILADTLLGSFHRSVLTGLQMLAPPSHPTKVFGDVPSSVKYLAPYAQEVCGPAAKADILQAGVIDLSARFVSRPAKSSE